MKRLDLINKKLRERNEARNHIKNVDKAMFEYYQVLEKKKKNLYHLSLNYPIFTIYQRIKKNGELLFVVVGTDIATYALYKYLR